MGQFSEQDLVSCRELIDEIDVKLVRLLNERTKVVEKIGAIKRSLKSPIYEPKRESAVIANVQKHNEGPLSPDAVQRVFERIMDEMRTLQKMKILEAERNSSDVTASGK
jgi:chorismate mutase-like protein